MTTAIAVCSVVALTPLITSVGAAPAAGSVRTPILRESHRPALGLGAHDGVEAVATAEFVPTAIDKSDKVEGIEYQLEVTSSIDGAVAAAWDIELRTDRGKLVEKLGAGEALTHAKGTAAARPVLPRPHDGYHLLVAHVAVSSKDRGDDLLRVEQPLLVRKGEVRELTAEEWHTDSAANLAFEENEIDEMGEQAP
jgi:hypothetical protein